MRKNDHFSTFAQTYASFRPTYPEDLFKWLAQNSPAPQHVWDCATDNRQAAQSLANHFDHVTATDVSSTMIAAAQPNPKITFQVAPAESTTIPAQTIDLITVAQALHWFDLPPFWALCRHAMKPNGLLAVWG
jgi:ubiquinone/menaquinone biosynthesis C-methylase UbiE